MLSQVKSWQLSAPDSLTGTTMLAFCLTMAMSMFLPMPTSAVLLSLATMTIPLQVTLVFSKLASVTVEDPPIPFSPFSLADCTLLDHFSFNDFIVIAFPDIAGDLDIQI